MNSDVLISWLTHSERLLPVLWVLMLAAAFAAAFPERSESGAQKSKGRIQRR